MTLSVPALRLLLAANPKGARVVLTKALSQEPHGVRHALFEEIISGLAPYEVFRYRNWMEAFVSPQLTLKNLVLLTKLRRAIEVQQGGLRLMEGDFVRHRDLEWSAHHFNGSARTFKRTIALALTDGALFCHPDGVGGHSPGDGQFEVGRILPRVANEDRCRF